MYVVGTILMFIVPLLVDDWHARIVFIATGYPRRYGHGKSFKRAKKHYKSNWTLIQRLLWIPLFKEEYETKYRAMAYLSYLHSALTLIGITCFLIDEFVLVSNTTFWHYVFCVVALFFMARFVYDSDIGAKKI